MSVLPDWAYKHKGLPPNFTGKCESSDPINLFFDNIRLNDIDSTFLSEKWRQPRATADNLYLDSSCSRRQDSQWTDAPVWRRFHIRLWEEGENVVGSAHYETLRAFHRHEVHHFEGAEDKVADLFEKDGWKVTRRSTKLQDPEFERYNDGFCTRITK